jgi:hypothetical protein
MTSSCFNLSWMHSVSIYDALASLSFLGCQALLLLLKVLWIERMVAQKNGQKLRIELESIL